MAYASRAYEHDYERERPDIQVVRTRRPARAPEPVLASWVKGAFRMIVTSAVVLAIACGVSVGFSVASVSTLEETQTLTSSIEDARATANSLEVKRSVLASPTRIQTIASDRLGMVPANAITYIDVSDDGEQIGAVSETTCSLSAAVSELASE